jgi:hypothetical protein
MIPVFHLIALIIRQMHVWCARTVIRMDEQCVEYLVASESRRRGQSIVQSFSIINNEAWPAAWVKT